MMTFARAMKVGRIARGAVGVKCNDSIAAVSLR